MTKLVKPTPSTNFVRGFDTNPRHSGIDYGWQYSRPIESRKVLAAAPGKVVSVYRGGGYNEGWGNRVIIEHAKNVYTTYNHLLNGSIKVGVGDKVNAGEHIATMGNTGKSGGTHLHFELYLGSHYNTANRVDPLPYFAKHLPGTSAPAPAGKPANIRQEITTTNVNLRRGRSTQNTVIMTVPKSAVVYTSAPKNGWRKVTYKGKNGYMADNLIVPRFVKAKANGGLNLRKSASTKGKVIATIPNGDRMTQVSVVGTTDAARWRKVTWKGQTGYVHADYIEYIY